MFILIVRSWQETNTACLIIATKAQAHMPDPTARANAGNQFESLRAERSLRDERSPGQSVSSISCCQDGDEGKHLTLQPGRSPASFSLSSRGPFTAYSCNPSSRGATKNAHGCKGLSALEPLESASYSTISRKHQICWPICVTSRPPSQRHVSKRASDTGTSSIAGPSETLPSEPSRATRVVPSRIAGRRDHDPRCWTSD